MACRQVCEKLNSITEPSDAIPVMNEWAALMFRKPPDTVTINPLRRPELYGINWLVGLDENAAQECQRTCVEELFKRILCKKKSSPVKDVKKKTVDDEIAAFFSSFEFGLMCTQATTCCQIDFDKDTLRGVELFRDLLHCRELPLDSLKTVLDYFGAGGESPLVKCVSSASVPVVGWAWHVFSSRTKDAQVLKTITSLSRVSQCLEASPEEFFARFCQCTSKEAKEAMLGHLRHAVMSVKQAIARCSPSVKSSAEYQMHVVSVANGLENRAKLIAQMVIQTSEISMVAGIDDCLLGQQSRALDHLRHAKVEIDVFNTTSIFLKEEDSAAQETKLAALRKRLDGITKFCEQVPEGGEGLQRVELDLDFDCEIGDLDNVADAASTAKLQAIHTEICKASGQTCARVLAGRIAEDPFGQLIFEFMSKASATNFAEFLTGPKVDTILGVPSTFGETKALCEKIRRSRVLHFATFHGQCDIRVEACSGKTTLGCCVQLDRIAPFLLDAAKIKRGISCSKTQKKANLTLDQLASVAFQVAAGILMELRVPRTFLPIRPRTFLPI